MSGLEKICVLCGKSCEGQPRIKNNKGQYAHQACVKSRQEQAAPEPEPVEGEVEDYALGGALGGMDDLLGDLPEQQSEPMGAAASACPSCGQRLNEGAMVCMGCGFNVQSGRAIKTVARDKKKSGKGAGAGAASLGAKAGGMALAPVLPLIGAVIGGAIGAAVWAGIAYQFNYEIGWIAIGVGFLCGLGAAIGARGEGGALTGGMAALVAMASISAGKYAAVSWAVNDAFGGTLFEPMVLEDLTEEDVLTSLADEICREHTAAGDPVEWDNPQIFLEAAMWPDDFPADIRGEVRDHWHGLSDVEKRKLRRDVGEEWDLSVSEVDDDWVLERLAFDMCESRLASGETIDWGNPDLPLQVTLWPDDYPVSVQEQTRQRWDAMSVDDQHVYRLDLLDETNAQRSQTGELGQAIVNEGFKQSFMHPLDLLFMLLAVGAAYGVASNETD